MLKLFKYEMRKTMVSKLVMLGLIVCLEALFLYGVFGGSQSTATIAEIVFIIIALMGVLIIGIQSVITLHHDMNTKQSYMLFMTPHSNYAILGAKVLECMLSILLTGVVFFGIIVLNYRLLVSNFSDIAELDAFIKPFISMLGDNVVINLPTIAFFAANTVISWFETVVLAFFADVLATSLLKGKKFGGFVAFVLFIVLTIVTERIAGLVPSGDSAATLLKSVVMLVIAGAVYVASAALMEKKLSV